MTFRSGLLQTIVPFSFCKNMKYMNMIHVYPRTRASSKDSKCQARQSVACPDPRLSWEKLFPAQKYHFPASLVMSLKCLGFAQELARACLSLETHFVINYDWREGGWKFVLWRRIIYQTPKVAESIKAYFECLDKRGFCVECLNRREALKTFTEATVSQICQDPIQANTKSVSIVLKVNPFEFLAVKTKS